ncbi:MAG: hypothetical protein ACKO0M_08855 [Cyanobium sp.]
MPLFRPCVSLITLATVAGAGLLVQGPALAQVESFLWGPGSNVGPATKVEPRNCRTAADGSVTCDTQLVNPAGDTPAKPQYEPFKN